MRELLEDGQHDTLFIPLTTRVALAAGVALILLFGIFPSAAMDFARDSVATLVSAGTSMAGIVH